MVDSRAHLNRAPSDLDGLRKYFSILESSLYQANEIFFSFRINKYCHQMFGLYLLCDGACTKMFFFIGIVILASETNVIY